MATSHSEASTDLIRVIWGSPTPDELEAVRLALLTVLDPRPTAGPPPHPHRRRTAGGPGLRAPHRGWSPVLDPWTLHAARPGQPTRAIPVAMRA